MKKKTLYMEFLEIYENCNIYTCSKKLVSVIAFEKALDFLRKNIFYVGDDDFLNKNNKKITFSQVKQALRCLFVESISKT